MLGHLRIDNPRTRVSSGEVNDDLIEISCEDSYKASASLRIDNRRTRGSCSGLMKTYTKMASRTAARSWRT